MNTNLIIKKRKQLGLSQGECAERIGIKQSTLSYIEKGLTEPQYSTFKKIAKTLNISYLDLLTNSKEVKKVVKKEILDNYLGSSQQICIEENEIKSNVLDELKEKIFDLEIRVQQLEKTEKIKEAERLKELALRIYGE